jgi:predicted ATPase with chaperone activity
VWAAVKNSGGHLKGLNHIPPYQSDFNYDLLDQPCWGNDFRDFKGQEHVKGALGVAAACGHCVLR